MVIAFSLYAISAYGRFVPVDSRGILCRNPGSPISKHTCASQGPRQYYQGNYSKKFYSNNTL